MRRIYRNKHLAIAAMSITMLLVLTFGVIPSSAVDWTFMVYLDGDNNLEGAGIDDLNEMEVAGSTSDVNVVVQFDRIDGWDSSNGDWTTARRYYVTQDTDPAIINSILIQDLGEVDMADPTVLADFAEWAIQNYPADKYALILWNHGDGWYKDKDQLVWVPWEDDTGEKGEEVYKGVIWDDTSGNHLSLIELKQALVTIKDGTGEDMDLLGFDACLMQMIEVAYQTKDYSFVQVGSEEVEPWDGWPYDMILSALISNPQWSPEELSIEIVYDYIASYGTSGGETQSSVDQTRLPSLAASVDVFAQELINNLPAYRDEIALARDQTESYYDPNFIDLYHFAERIYANVPDASLRNAATSVMNNVVNTVIAEAHGSGHPNSHGLTIYFPWDTYHLVSYGEIDFAIDTRWDDFLWQYYSSIIYVPDDYAKIQWAVDNASAGDTIIVRDGLYVENVDVNKRLTIQSENGAANCIVDSYSGYHVFDVTADGVSIIGFTATGATSPSRG